MIQKFAAEFLGTIALCSVVLLSLTGTFPIPTPVLVGLLVGVLMYSIGHVAGLHINPAVTLGLLSVRKIDLSHAAVYLVAQALGAGVALYAVSYGAGHMPALEVTGSFRVWIAEIVGTMLLCTGIGSVAFGKIHENMFGLVLGASVLVGVSIAVLVGSNGMLNPAVAFATSSVNLTYMLAPIIGAVIGFNLYKRVMI